MIICPNCLQKDYINQAASLLPNTCESCGTETDCAILPEERLIKKSIHSNIMNEEKINEPTTPVEEVKEIKKRGRPSKPKQDIIPLSESIDVVPLTDVITQELTKHNITEAVLAEMEANFLVLTIQDINDKDGYEAVNKARILCKNTRVLTTKLCKEGRDEAILIQRSWISKEKEIVDRIEKVEKNLSEKQKVIDDIKEAAKREKELIEQRRLQERSVKLIQYGMTLVGDNYILEDVSISTIEVKSFDEFVFGQKESQVKAIFERKEQERLIEEARVKAILEEQRTKEAELKKKEEELTARQKAIEEAEAKAKLEEENKRKETDERIKKEKEEKELAIKKLIEDRLKARKSSLFQLGFAQQNDKLTFQDQSILDNSLHAITDELWPSYIEAMTKIVNDIKVRLEQERLNREEMVKVEIEAQAKLKFQKEQEDLENAKLAKEKEEKRLADLKPNKDKIIAFFTAISQIPIPECSEDFKNYCAEIQTSRKEWIKTLFKKMPE